MIRSAIGAYRGFATAASWLRSPFLLAVRLYWGWQFMQTGWGKLHNLERVTGFFASLGIPFPHANAIFVAGAEFVGGALLILGLGSRLVGLVLAGDMLVAYLAASRDALLAIFSDPGKFYGADAYTFLFAALMVLIFGAGALSLDHLVAAVLTRHDRNLRRDNLADFPIGGAKRKAN
jgi:putative oxidoreductase